MIHLGDITQLKGNNVPLVDIVCGGSPCQDLSVAGKRAGLDGERSGLFMEQIRIVKEMRDESIRQLQLRGADVDFRLIKPRFMVWENVPGAFSSNKGRDFKVVLEEICRIKDKDATVPMPEKGKWSTSGCIMGDGYSVAWRVHDAQFWGVPQRRKRISLVADFGGQSAPEILFERKSVPRDIEEGRKEREGASTDTERSVDKTNTILMDAYQHHGYRQSETCGTLTADQNQGIRGDTPIIVKNNTISFQERAGKPGGGKGILIQNERTGALSTLNNQSACYGVDAYNQTITGEKTMSITGAATDPHHIPCTVYCLQGNGIDRADTAGCNGKGWRENQSYTLNTIDRPAVYSIGHDIRSARSTDDEITDPLTANDYKDPIKINDCRKTYQDTVGALCAVDYKGAGRQYVNDNKCVVSQSVVRRLTPLECERLQGFPDNWTNIGEWVDSKGKKHKDADSPRYKALGNSIALPFWEWMAERMIKELNVEHPTMASLFDGIGGFPLVYSRCGCKPLWASEIEEFPMAVTKLRFPEESEG